MSILLSKYSVLLTCLDVFNFVYFWKMSSVRIVCLGGQIHALLFLHVCSNIFWFSFSKVISPQLLHLHSNEENKCHESSTGTMCLHLLPAPFLFSKKVIDWNNITATVGCSVNELGRLWYNYHDWFFLCVFFLFCFVLVHSL